MSPSLHGQSTIWRRTQILQAGIISVYTENCAPAGGTDKLTRSARFSPPPLTIKRAKNNYHPRGLRLAGTLNNHRPGAKPWPCRVNRSIPGRPMQRPVPQGGSPRGHVLRVARPGGDVDGDVVRADEGAGLVVGRRTDVDLAQAIRRGQRSCPSQRARRRWSAPRHRSAAAAGPPRPHRRRSRLAEGQQDNIPRAAPCGSPSGAHEDRTAHPGGGGGMVTGAAPRRARCSRSGRPARRSRGPPAGSPSACAHGMAKADPGHFQERRHGRVQFARRRALETWCAARSCTAPKTCLPALGMPSGRLVSLIPR